MYFTKIYNHTSLYDPTVSGATVNPTLESFNRYVGITYCRKSKSANLRWIEWHKFDMKFQLNLSRSSQVKSCRQTDRHGQPLCLSFLLMVQRTYKALDVNGKKTNVCYLRFPASCFLPIYRPKNGYMPCKHNGHLKNYQSNKNCVSNTLIAGWKRESLLRMWPI